MDETKEIDLRQIMQALLKKAWLIFLCAVVVGAAVLAYTVYFVTPLYEASISVYVNNTNVGQVSGISSSDLATSQRLVATYIITLMSDSVMDKVAQEAGLNVSADQLRSIIQAESLDGTEVFEVRVTHADPDLAARVANAVATVAPAEISNIIEGSSTKIVDWAKVPAEPYTPSYLKNTVLGAIVGVLLAALVIVMQVLLDVRIKGEEDLARISQAPVLGNIPDFNTEVKSGYTYESEAGKDVKGKAVGK